MLSLRQELLRRYIKYLLMEVTVVPLEDFEVEILSGKYKFVVGEETKIPRWLARILEKKGKIKIKNETDVKDIIGRLPYYIVRESEGAGIEIEPDLYIRAKEYLEKLENANAKERIKQALMQFVRIRLPKVLRRAITPAPAKDVLLWEDVLVMLIKKIHERWIKALFETDFSTINEKLQ